ncbi:MAG: NlpC/P60 family protein [Ruminococcaceae bacterium]|nr:NlpC/P60 family protein [Oscillospiraceae bacterium]
MKKEVFMVFIKGQVSLFDKPELSSQHIDEALYGMKCELLERANGFLKIKTEYGYEGYVLEDSVIDADYEPDGIVIAPAADIYVAPKLYHGPTASLPRGARVKLGETAEDNRFREIITPNGEKMYVFHRLVAPFKLKTDEDRKNENEEMLRDLIVKTAKKYEGTCYRWGGKTVSGIDCSGLAFMSYYLNGYYIFRDAKPDFQTRFRKIGWNEVKKGDLLYYPGHVAIYMGNGEIIHSSSSYGCVTINDLDPLSLKCRESLKDIICACTFF